MRLLIALLFVLTSFIAHAQEQSESSKLPPATKLEAFSARTGIVVLKGFSNLGVFNGMGRVSIDAHEFRDASNPKSAQYGVAFEVKRLERENTSYIDEDEIDSLIRGLEYISKIAPSVTSLSNFEAQYKTKGDLSMSVFYGHGGVGSFVISSGRIGKTTALLLLTDADKIRNLLGESKRVIAAAKLAVK